MKKELTVLSLALVPALGFAQATAITGSTTVNTVQCTLLQDNLNISLSNGVVGAWNCDTATTNTISVAACHTNGRVTSRSAVASVPAGCGTGTNTCTGTTTTTTTGAVVAVASTQGGSLATRFPGSNCDTAGSLAAGQL